MKTQKLLSTIIAILLVATIATAVDWTSYTPSPTVNAILRIRTLGNTAEMIDSVGGAYTYNGSNWAGVTLPNMTNIELVQFDHAENGVYYWAFKNTTGTINIYNLNPITRTFTFNETFDYGVETWTQLAFNCIRKGAGYTASQSECWVATQDTNFRGVLGTSNIAGAFGAQDVYANRNLYEIRSTGQTYRWTGSVWSSILGATGAPNYMQEYNSQYIYTLTPPFVIRRWNQLTINFESFAPNISNMIVMNPDTLGVYGDCVNDNTKICKTTNYFDNTSSIDSIKGTNSDMRAGDVDENTLTGWIGLNNGRLFYFIGTAGGGEFDLYTSISSNPTIYGTNTIITAIPQHNSGYSTSITVNFYAPLDPYPIYTYICPSVSNGQTCSNSITGNTWTNFQVGTTYTINLTSTWTNGNIMTKTINWTITANATQNTTIYNTTNYQTTGYTDVIGIDKKGANNIFATAKIGSIMKILTYDVTNPNNIITKEINVTATGTYPTSLSLGTNTRLYLGTDNKLTTFNNTELADATQLTLNSPDAGFAFLTKPYVYDTLALDDTLAWLCNDGYISDEARLYNYTTNTMTDTISENPCLSIITQNNLLIIHKGTSGIKIYNATTHTLISTITSILSQPSGATHDRLTTYGNYLFAITGQTQISKYNITNPTSPTKIDDCYTNNAVKSIEALSDNEIIIGTDTNLRVCDFANPNKFDQTSQKYTSTIIKTYLNNENPQETLALDTNGKFAVAEGTGIGIYYYTKSIQQTLTNNPPTITSITPSTTTPCVDQTILVTIEATDPENDPLTYDYDCNGIEAIMTHNYIGNTFTCTYPTTGTKTIKAWARDASPTPVLATTTISVFCTDANFLNFKIYDYDQPATPLAGVLVNAIGQTSGVTNTAGLVSLTLTTNGTYQVAFSKSGYQSQTKTYQTYNGDYLLYLRSNNLPSGAQRNILQAIIMDTQGTPLENALFTSTDPITAIAQTTSSDFTGTATLNDVPAQIPLRISAGKSGYVSQFTETTIQQGETKTITFQLLRTGQTANASTSRGCKDALDGVFLCSPLNVNGTGDTCATDTDCLSGRCMPSPSNVRTCSTFNWTQCDSIGYPRGNQCFLKFTAQGTAGNFTNMLLDNFLYVLVFIALLIIVLLIVRSVSKT